jgi:hypothetical protein
MVFVSGYTGDENFSYDYYTIARLSDGSRVKANAP